MRFVDATHNPGTAYDKIEERFSAVKTASKERFYRRQKDTITVNSNATQTPQKKRNAPLPPSTNASNNKDTKTKNRLYPDITDAASTSTHTYFVLEEPESSLRHLRKQPKTSSNVEALPEIPVSCLADIYGLSGSAGLDELADESSERLVPEHLAGLSKFSQDVCASVSATFRSDLRYLLHLHRIALADLP